MTEDPTQFDGVDAEDGALALSDDAEAVAARKKDDENGIIAILIG